MAYLVELIEFKIIKCHLCFLFYFVETRIFLQRSSGLVSFCNLNIFLLIFFLCFIMFSLFRTSLFHGSKLFAFLTLNFLDSLYPNLLNSPVMSLISFFYKFFKRVFVTVKLFICELMDFFCHELTNIYSTKCTHFSANIFKTLQPM